MKTKLASFIIVILVLFSSSGYSQNYTTEELELLGVRFNQEQIKSIEESTSDDEKVSVQQLLEFNLGPSLSIQNPTAIIPPGLPNARLIPPESRVPALFDQDSLEGIETEVISLTVAEAREYPGLAILLPDSWPSFISERALERGYVRLKRVKSHSDHPFEMVIVSEMVIPEHLRLLQLYLVPMSPHLFTTLYSEKAVVRAAIIGEKPALVFKDSTVTVMWEDGDSALYLETLREGLSEVDVLLFAHSLR